MLRLAKAMPSSADQPGLVLELDRLARSTGVKLGSITPREPLVTAGGPTAIPVVVTAEGSYRQITRFVRRARELVRFSGGKVRATGRLFTVQAVELAGVEREGLPVPRRDDHVERIRLRRPDRAVTPPPSPGGRHLAGDVRSGRAP